MDQPDFTFVNEDFHAVSVSPADMDRLLSEGWRHFGKYFFRYSIAFHDFRYRKVLPLRIRLENFSLSKSLRRIRRVNEGLHTKIGPSSLDKEKEDLFHIHKERFRGPRPGSILNFLDAEPGYVPAPGLEVTVRDEEENLMAVSFVDNAEDSLSAIYAMFDPGHSNRSLGIFTMLKEIEHAQEMGKTFYYLGYAYEGSSFYDYKKRFRGIERYDWRGNWIEYDGA